MKMKKYIPFVAAVLAVISSCKKEFDSPPVKEIPVGSVITLDSLRGMFTGTPIKFTQDYSVYGVITADETSGNLYKNIYMSDGTAAINLRLLVSGGVYQGDSIRLYLKGCVLSQYNGMLQVDSVNTDNNIIKQASGKVVIPETVTISQINTNLQQLEGHLVKIDSVQFIASDAGTTYANAVTQASASKTIEDCSGNTVILRNSGYANFAGSPTATGKGSVIAIVGDYNNTVQLYIRSINDVNMPTARCGGASLPYLSKNFDDGSVTSGGWLNTQVSGTISWGLFSGDIASISNYISPSNYACETWLISPAIDLSGATTPNLYFESAYKYTGPALQLMVSTNYSGSGDPNLATWTNLTSSAIWSTGNFVFASSGAVSLNAFKVAGVRFAYKYTGTSSSGSTWEVDNIVVQEN
jgi:hypothetical protein